MNTPNTDTPPRLGALKVEVGASKRPFRFRRVWLVRFAMLAVALGAGGAWLYATVPAPTIDAVAVSPQVIAVGTRTSVLVTARIESRTLNPASVELLHVDERGKTQSLGHMWDNGSNGDVRARDKVFSRAVNLKRTEPGEVRLQVSAAFRGLSRRIRSDTITVSAWLQFANDNDGYRITYEPQFGISNINSPRPGFVSGTLFSVADDMPNVSVMVYSNPQHLPVEQWYTTTLADQEFSFTDAATRTTSAVVIAGSQSLQVRSTLLGVVHLRTFVPDGGLIFGIETSVPDDAAIPASYFRMLETFRIE